MELALPTEVGWMFQERVHTNLIQCLAYTNIHLTSRAGIKRKYYIWCRHGK